MYTLPTQINDLTEANFKGKDHRKERGTGWENPK